MNSGVASGALSARTLLRWQFWLAHELLDATIERLPTEAAHRRQPGTAAPVGACYAQVVVCEDLSVNGVLAAGTPLALSSWVGRTGLSAALPDEALDPARGEMPACLLNALLLTLSMRRGEIACLLALEHRPSADETGG
jgi:hypothetical protein